MPVEFGERHITGVRHGDVVAHLAARQGLSVAPLGDGDAQVGGLVVVGQLNDLAGIFQRLIKHGAAELPVGRSGHLSDLVAAQG